MGVIGGADGSTEILVSSNFGWINFFGLILLALLLAPNLIWAIYHKGEKNKCANRLMNVLEQIGRYGCMLLMVFNIGIAEFGFASPNAFLVYLFGSAALLLGYWAFWIVYFKKQTPFAALLLAILPTLLFLLCGLTLRHWPLVFFSLLFGVAHIYVTVQNCKAQ